MKPVDGYSQKSFDFRDLWNGMMEYYSMGLSMIWSRIESEFIGGEEKLPKTPIGKWKTAQQVRWTEAALSAMMMKSKVGLAPTIVTGEVSGNLELIDVDVKNWPGIDALLFSQIEKLFPHIWNTLRIHRTTSGGYHLLYRCTEPIKIGNKKLATKVDEEKAGIETRGEGGYALCPPGVGYTVYKDRPIPVYTREERDALITICKLFDQKVKLIATKTLKSYDSVYDENPFEHYNSSSEAEILLTNFGWMFDSETSEFTHYTRPGKSRGISASWIKDKRCYHIFTSSSQFDNEKNYTPSKVLQILQFSGDGKVTFKYLTDKGYGKVKKSYEEKKIKEYTLQPDKELPANFTEEAKKKLKDARDEVEGKYPYGIYWEYHSKSNSYTVSLPKIFSIANKIGVARFRKNLIKKEGVFFRHIDLPEVLTLLSDYIKEEEEDYFKIKEALLIKWKGFSHFFMDTHELEAISEKDILRSSESIFYKPFRNGVLEISAKGDRFVEDMDSYGKLIDRDSVIQFDFSKIPEEEYRKCKYVRYLDLSIRSDKQYVQQCIGYLCYDWKLRGRGYLMMLLEGTVKGAGGGSGKGVFFHCLGDSLATIKKNGLKKWTSVKSISANQMKKGESEMLQTWKGEKIVHFSDAPRSIKLSDIKDVTSDGGTVKYLYKDVISIDAEDYPNIGISSQWGINSLEDPGVRGRVRILTFTGHFSREYEVRDEFGGSFPEVWSDEDWLGYYNYIADGIQMLLKNGGKIEAVNLDDFMWEKNFDESYGGGEDDLRNWISSLIMEWEPNGFVTSAHLIDSFNLTFKNNQFLKNKSVSWRHEAIKNWCERHDFEYIKSERPTINGIRDRSSIIRKKTSDDAEDQL